MNGWLKTARVAMISLLSILASCAQTATARLDKSNPLESITSPVAAWDFDDCEADPEWTYKVEAEGSAENWVSMTPIGTPMSGCAALLKFGVEGASVAIDPEGVKGEGYGLSLRAKFNKHGEAIDDVTTTWTFALASTETGEGDPEKLWKYAIEAVLSGGVLKLGAYGYRESPWGGVDLPKVEVATPPGAMSLDQWYALSMVVDRTAGTLSLWVDGEKQGLAAFDYKTFDSVDRFSIRSEALRPLSYVVKEGEDGGRYRPSELYVDNVGLYSLGATELKSLAP
jgi:hypothetical protein